MAETPMASLVTPPPDAETAASVWPRLSWGLLLLLVVVALLVAFGAPLQASFVIGAILAVVIAWRYPYGTFYLSLATAPLLGILVSISTGQLEFGERAFGGSIDVTIGDLVAAAVLAAWGLRILLLWRGRRDRNWKPWLPLFVPYLALVGAHLLSAFSPAMPDPVLVVKYALRPVFFVYLTSVALPANFIRSRRRLLASLAVLTLLGTFFALDGFRSLFFFEPGAFLPSAHPLPILGVSPIGENHNILAELLLFTTPIALALSALARSLKVRTATALAAAFMALIALLTFARSAWIAMGIELLFLFATVWKEWIKKQFATLLVLLILFLPVAGYMVIFSNSFGAQSSTDTRTMLSEIALNLFEGSPWVGVGAGTFVTHMANTYIFTYEFGSPLDSHGILQKIAAETGIIGLITFAFVLLALAGRMRAAWKRLRPASAEGLAYAFLVAAVLGAFTYQLFNTTYWTPKLWLSVGLVLAAERVFLARHAERDPDFLLPFHG